MKKKSRVLALVTNGLCVAVLGGTPLAASAADPACATAAQVSAVRAAFAKPFVWWIRDDLDADAVRAAAEAFVGLNDFRAFSDDDPEEKSTKVLLEEAGLVQK